MCLVCSSFSFREKVWECLNPVENLFILTYCWNYCASGCFWSSGEESGLIAGKGKAVWCLQMMVIHDACEAGPKWDTSAMCFREYPNAWNSSGKVGPPSVHDQSLVSQCLLEEQISCSWLEEAEHGFGPCRPRKSLVLSAAPDECELKWIYGQTDDWIFIWRGKP